MVLSRITDADVHTITSGQVIIELASIIKELLENSIDANATSISITFKRYGLEGIEFQDNGDGIKQEDFNNLCLKNYTSKLENFESLTDTKTLGFRGEALNSICNVSQMIIKTASVNDAPKGYELIYDKFGKLVNKQMVNQTKGTLIKVSDIFKDLPVRKLNLEKHYKKEFQNCLNLLTQYLIILTNTRILVSNIDISGRKKVILKTSGNKLIKDNIVNVFGSSGLQGLNDIAVELDLDDSYVVKLNGMVSKASIGEGRLTKDRQYIFINKRPVKFQKIIKLMNQLYKKYNYLQSPVIVLNLELDVKLLDINVTPDKSIVLIFNKYENILLNRIESYLEDFWDNSGNYNFPVNEITQEKIKERNVSITQPKLESFALFQEGESIETDTADEVEVLERKSVRNSRVVNINTLFVPDELSEHEEIDDGDDNDNGDNDGDDDGKNDYEGDNGVNDINENLDVDVDENVSKNKIETVIKKVETEFDNTNIQDEPTDLTGIQKLTKKTRSSLNDTINDAITDNDNMYLEENIINSQLENSINAVIPHTEEIDPCCSSHSGHSPDKIPDSRPDNPDEINLETELIYFPNSENNNTENEKVIPVSNQKIRVLEDEIRLPQNKRLCVKPAPSGTSNVQTSDFTDREASEQLLGLSIHKTDFNSMNIIGQFNKGFIIVHKKDTDDILIVDQHASDEKYNFENLNNETTFKNQPLVVPQKLDLNSIERLIILNNLEIFEKNGFRFKDNSSAASDEKQEEIYLTSLPYSKNTIFNLKDLSELIQLVQDSGSSTNAIIRPSKVRAMFAMRACRSSIMIGQPLSQTRMETVVQHLSTLDKPWNCPHGRPTMRHIVKIDQWKPFNDDYQL